MAQGASYEAARPGGQRGREHATRGSGLGDWDLTGLAEGLPAVPTARSSYPTSAPRPSLLLDEFIAAHAEAGGAFVDHRIVDEVVDGISDDVTVERGSFLCAPYAGAMWSIELRHRRGCSRA